MSNNPSQRVVVRLQPAALVFIVLVLVIGAMLLASNNLDPNSVKRAAFSPTPIDYFAAITYANWKSPDGLLRIDYPSAWKAQADPGGNAFQYLIAANTTDGPYVSMRMGQLVTNQTASELLAQATSNGSGTAQPPAAINPVEYAGMKGASTIQTFTTTDALGQAAPRNGDLIVLNLDVSHVLLIQSVSGTEDWLKMQPIVDHMLNSLSIDKAAAIREINAALATPEATGAATPNASAAANAAAPSAATPAPTTAATPAASAAATGTQSF